MAYVFDAGALFEHRGCVSGPPYVMPSAQKVTSRILSTPGGLSCVTVFALI
ncbi:hypothetical protein ACF1BE_31895 [Streptomyces sp. NPDC014991]|uniref:hypothetical protein n=1 Tax=Streptomyces sp. NPDC014991 TaxID=3364935 RepID=UPI0036FB90BA